VTPTTTTTITPTPVPTPSVIWVYPNPFNPKTAAGRALKFDNLPPVSDIRIYTVTGELVRTFTAVSGRILWDGKNTTGADVVSGIYLYMVTLPNGEKITGKIYLITQ